MAKIIVIEGPDRTGKATQAALLRDYLLCIGKRAVVVEVPIKDSHTYDKIYWMLRTGTAKTFPRIFQALQCLNRLMFQTFELPRLESENDYIIFDRWSLSSVVYGLAESLSEKFVTGLSNVLRTPDFTFVLVGKAHPHEAEDAYERDVILQERVRRLYAAWASQADDRAHGIECSLPRDVIFSEILGVLQAARIVPMPGECKFVV